METAYASFTPTFSRQRACRCYGLAAMAIILLLTATSFAADVHVGTCGTTVAANTTGFLAGDLSCTGFVGDAVTLEKGATLELRGFTLTGDPLAAPANGVTCIGGCKVVGPGTIQTFSQHGIVSPSRVTVRDLTLSGMGQDGVHGYPVTVSDSTISDNAGDGVYAIVSAIVTRCSIVRNGSGVRGAWRGYPFAWRASVLVKDSTVTDNSLSGVFSKQVAAINSTIDRNLYGINAFSIRLIASSASHNSSDGVIADGDRNPKVKLVDSTVSGNGGNGVRALWAVSDPDTPTGSLIARNSVISGNDGHGIDTFRAVVNGGEVSDNASDGIVAVQATVRGAAVSGNGADGVATYRWLGDRRDWHSRAIITSSSVIGNAVAGVRGVHKIKLTSSTLAGNGLADIYATAMPTVSSVTCETSYSPETGTDWDICSLDPM